MHRNVRPTFEPLESRQLLAGNVTAVLDGGDLDIRGDNLGNRISVTQIGPGTYRVTGIGTTVNGGAGPVDIAGVTDDVDIRLGDGDDAVLVFSAEIPDELEIRTRGGNDLVTVSSVSVNGETEVKTKDGIDLLEFIDCTFRGEFELKTGNGDDFAEAENCTFFDEAEFDMDDGNDELIIYGGGITGGSTFFDEVEIELDDGDDLLGVQGSTFHDEVEADGDDDTDCIFDGGGNVFEDDFEIDDFERFNDPLCNPFLIDE
jgi:hypothetical protein